MVKIVELPPIMKLWLLEYEDAGWEENEAVVVRAYTEERARHLAQSVAADEAPREWHEKKVYVWLDSTKTTCTEIAVCGDEDIIAVSNRGA